MTEFVHCCAGVPQVLLIKCPGDNCNQEIFLQYPFSEEIKAKFAREKVLGSKQHLDRAIAQPRCQQCFFFFQRTQMKRQFCIFVAIALVPVPVGLKQFQLISYA